MSVLLYIPNKIHCIPNLQAPVLIIEEKFKLIYHENQVIELTHNKLPLRNILKRM